MNVVLLERKGAIKIYENRLRGKRMACTSEGYKLKTYKHITKERVGVTCPEQIIGKFSNSSLELKNNSNG